MELVILLIVLFILVPLANYVLERMRRRVESPRPNQPPPMPDMRARRPAPAPPTPAPAASRERAQTVPPAPIAATPARSRWSRKALFRTKRDVRRTIVAMTILGPCRAYDPPN